MTVTAWPRLDEHTTCISADADVVWSALVETLDRGFARPAASLYARMVGCEESTASGPRPFVEGATIPGFRVTGAVPGRQLVLEGRHRFSSYALRFRLEERGAGQTTLRAESRAQFPGALGRAYRLLVVGSGGHVFAVRRLLSSVRRRAEQLAGAQGHRA